jgi:hypothetical protein
MGIKNWQTHVTVVTSFVMANATLYMIGYWSVFGINILQYIAFSDVLKLAARQLIFYLVPFFVGVALAELRSDNFSPGEGQNTKIGRFGRRYWRVFLGLDIIAVIVLLIFVVDPVKWLFAAFMLGTPLASALSHFGFIIDLVPNPKIRLLIIFIILVLPILSYGWGNTDAVKIRTGRPERQVDVKNSVGDIANINETHLAYLGLAGNYHFLFSKLSDRVFIIKNDSVKILVLTKESIEKPTHNLTIK